MRKMNVIVFSIAALLFTMGVASKASAQAKIAYVDLRRALNETEDGRKAMERLTKMKEDLQAKISASEQSVLKMKEEIEKQQSVLTKEALQKKAQDYYKAVTDLQQNYTTFQRDLAKKEAEETKAILDKMRDIIGRIGKSDNYALILDISSGAVAWAPTHLDLTDKLIQQYNKENPPKK